MTKAFLSTFGKHACFHVICYVRCKPQATTGMLMLEPQSHPTDGAQEYWEDMNEDTVVVAGSVAIGVMCQAPIAGACKARLTPPLSRDEAAGLSRCFIADVVELAAGLPDFVQARCSIVFGPASAEAAFDELLPDKILRIPQRGEDMGERCANAIEDLFAKGYGAVCLLNADCPTLPPAVLQAAVEILRLPRQRMVLGPALDGGHYLIGVNRFVPELLRNVARSSGHILAQSATSAEELGMVAERLPAWYDVDDGMSLSWLMRELFGDGLPPVTNGLTGAPARQTKRYLAALAGRGDGPPVEPHSDI
jgi:uncharacterized protein